MTPFATLDVSRPITWISAIPFTAWPQQTPLNGQLRPAMVSDPNWNWFARATDPLVYELLAHFPGCTACNRLLSVVMPGHGIDPHKDARHPLSRGRVHVPLLTNPLARFVTGGVAHHLEAGKAYLIDTATEHAVYNNGPTPRLHFMFDVRENAAR